MCEEFLHSFKDRYVAIDQSFTMEYKKMPFVLTVEKVLGGDSGYPFLGLETKVTCIASGQQNIRLKSAKMEHKNIFS